MSPHFYIVYFLICVKLSICYEYYDRNSNDKREVKKNIKVKHNRGRDAKLSKDPNAQFDLAGFLNVADEVSVGDTIPHYRKSGHNSKDYNDYGSIVDSSVENIKSDNPDFLSGAYYNRAESNANPSEFKFLSNEGQFNVVGLNNNEKLVRSRNDKAVTLKLHDDQLVDRVSMRHPEKKCSFRKMKFPFFSHNKSQSTKKAKKRKMFCLNCKKNDAATTSTGTYELRSKNKRSYIEKLCPECQKKFRAEIIEELDEGKRRLNQRMIHNSRQYFAQIQNRGKENLELQRMMKTRADDSSTNTASPVQNARRKRDEFEERDRRLKELDQIQRKVENVEINMPNFEKANQI